MNKNYQQLTEQVRSNLNPDGRPISYRFSQELSTLTYSDVLVYVRLAMKAVDQEYTQQTKEAGNNAKTHLDRELVNVSFKYQGSVMTNTHIRGFSDIDLVTISEDFYGFQRAEINQIISSPERRVRFTEASIKKLAAEAAAANYNGAPLDVLHQLRLDCESILSRKYSICDRSKGKSIKITNTSLRRDVDVVVANWFDDIMSVINDKGEYRGIQVYDKIEKRRCDADYPFVSILKINARGNDTKGRLKKMIRFLKNCKCRSDHEIALSSFDINAICYDIEPNTYSTMAFYQLVAVLCGQLTKLANDTTYANRLVSVDGREYIFRNKPEKIEGVKLLLAELSAINADLANIPRKPYPAFII